MTKTTIDIFLNMNQDYQRLVLTNLFDLIQKLQHTAAALKTKTTDIRYNLEAVDDIRTARKALSECAQSTGFKELSYIDEEMESALDNAEKTIQQRFDDVKTLNKQRLPFINRIFEISQALTGVCADPKKTAEFLRQKELNDKS